MAQIQIFLAYGETLSDGLAGFSQGLVFWLLLPQRGTKGLKTEDLTLDLDNGDTVYNTLYYTSVYGGGGVSEALWGENEEVNIGEGEPEDIDDNIFVWGLGFVNLNKIKLES